MFGGQFGPVAQPTDMRDVAQADGCNAMSACLVDTDFGGRFGGKLAVVEVSRGGQSDSANMLLQCSLSYRPGNDRFGMSVASSRNAICRDPS